jgi:ADP-ribosylglycohydrolase
MQNASCTLMRAQEVKMVTHLRAPAPYRPGTGCYLEDLDWEVDFQLLETDRPGRMDTKALALFRDGCRCRKCGVRVTYGNSEADHIVPVKCFASFQQADVPTNVQILCLACHKDKTAASR